MLATPQYYRSEKLINYFLQLANGYRLCFTATREAKSWVEKLSAIMQLSPYLPSPVFLKVIFIRGSLSDKIELTHNLDIDLLSTIPDSGWRLHNYNILQLWFHPDVSDVICNIGQEENYELEIIKMQQSIRLIYYKLAQDLGCIPLHSALIEKHGTGIVLVAQGGIGKSTCCNRIPHPWRPLCDDEVLIVPKGNGRYMVHPFPTWSSYLVRRQIQTWNVQQHVPLRAIFFLERSLHDQAIAMGQGQSAVYINDSARQVFGENFGSQSREEILSFEKNLIKNLCELAKMVPAFKLRINLTGRFWEEIEEVTKIWDVFI